MVRILPIPVFFALASAIFAQEPGETPAPAGIAPFSPQSYSIDRYSELWSKSPFDFEIVLVEETSEEENPLDDMFLASFSDRGSYYVATIYDPKSPNEKIRIDSRKDPDENGGYRFIQNLPGPTYKQREVELEINGKTGRVGYDTKRFSKALVAAAGGNSRNGTARNNNRQAAARTAAARTAAAARSGNQRTPNQANNKPAAGGQNATAGNTNANAAGTDRNAVIQRLLDRARQNQNGGTNAAPTTTGANPSASGSSDAAARPRRRRVVLPPSDN